MNYNTENAKKIQEYIDSHLTEIEIDDKDPCNNTELIKLTQSDGTVKKQKIKVIKLPLELLFHNVRNGRSSKRTTGRISPKYSQRSRCL